MSDSFMKKLLFSIENAVNQYSKRQVKAAKHYLHVRTPHTGAYF